MNPIWLLYAYKETGSDGEELRYSLRSIEQNLHMGEVQVMIVGDKPSWLQRASYVEGNPFEEYGVRNSLWNIAAASEVLGNWGVKQAYYLDDDYLLMYPQEDIIPVSQGPLDPYLKRMFRGRSKEDWWRIAAEGTQSILRSAGRYDDAMSFDMHHPLPFKPRDAHNLLTGLTGRPLLWRTIYGNLVGFDRPVRTAKDGLYYGATPMKIGLPWVSAIPSQWEAHMRRRAERMFKRPSQFEAMT